MTVAAVAQDLDTLSLIIGFVLGAVMVLILRR